MANPPAATPTASGRHLRWHVNGGQVGLDAHVPEDAEDGLKPPWLFNGAQQASQEASR
jgi:hypothetical protein